MFMMIDVSGRGFFEGCRQFIGVNGCYLTGPYKGVLLTVVGIDAKYGIYPLALSIVESENTHKKRTCNRRNVSDTQVIISL